MASSSSSLYILTVASSSGMPAIIADSSKGKDKRKDMITMS